MPPHVFEIRILTSLILSFLLLAPWRTSTLLDLPVRVAVKDGGQEPSWTCRCELQCKTADKYLVGPAGAHLTSLPWQSAPSNTIES